MLDIVWAPDTTLEVFYNNQRFTSEQQGEARAGGVVEPGTGKLELRTARGKVIRSQYLRAQPGYRYEVIVSYAGNRDEEAQLVVTPVSPHLQAFPTETITFTQTGHYLDGRLRQYWEGTGGLPVFGYPLNDDHLTKTPEGRYVTQTFERNRLEYHPEKTAPYDVLLGRLGAERLVQLGRDWRKEWTRAPIGEGCMPLFAETTEFALCEPFRTYYRTHGLELDGQRGFTNQESLALFGLPLTQAKLETNSSGDRVLTQWFERARFEYHPKNPRGQQVLLGRLGAEVYDLQPLTFDDEDRGFQRMTDIGVSDWNEAEGGFGGHFWWTCTEGAGGKQYSGMRMAQWIGPRIPHGTYEVQVFVPGTHAGSTSVPYTVRISLDEGVVHRLDQSPWSNQWVKLVTLELGSAVGVYIHTNTGERGTCAHHLAADAIRLVPR